ncbi:hypothetical protein [Sediminibacillus albus]|uniref:Uncharacterized protein n=1 Tax=Sediminibacillus albus TaxID=407036 RepID=A0A1G9A0Z4_9BACI|nr:hypothetical protein [Sediminibacillus albus]SDK21032.1 hypothetical protein SAMN05216243_2344 [Sediminibacillus albus]
MFWSPRHNGALSFSFWDIFHPKAMQEIQWYMEKKMKGLECKNTMAAYISNVRRSIERGIVRFEH